LSGLSDPADNVIATTLSDDDRAILDFERRPFKYAGRKEAAIRDRFGISAWGYYARLNRILDTEAALAADPLLVRRLRRLRASRQAARTSTRGTAARRLEFMPYVER
jgi:hypothetical protein